MKAVIKRIVNIDLKNINNSKLDEQGIFIKFDEENMMKATAMIIGPKDSLYEHGILLFDITFPANYPFSPPILTYKAINSIRIHPNLYVNGKVCLSILGTWSGPKWTSIMDITTVLLTIQSLLDNNPLRHEPGQEKNASYTNTLYNEIIKYESLNTLLLKNYFDPPLQFECFREDMQKELNKIGIETIISKTKELCNEKEDCTTNVPIYRINTRLNYTQLSKNIERLKQ
jgi:ubiquitin-protein ligase